MWPMVIRIRNHVRTQLQHKVLTNVILLGKAYSYRYTLALCCIGADPFSTLWGPTKWSSSGACHRKFLEINVVLFEVLQIYQHNVKCLKLRIKQFLLNMLRPIFLLGFGPPDPWDQRPLIIDTVTLPPSIQYPLSSKLNRPTKFRRELRHARLLTIFLIFWLSIIDVVIKMPVVCCTLGVYI